MARVAPVPGLDALIDEIDRLGYAGDDVPLPSRPELWRALSDLQPSPIPTPI
jgi:hypothetical protein